MIWKEQYTASNICWSKIETLTVASSSQSVLRVCAQFGNTVTTLEGSSYLIVVIIIITARPHTLDWLFVDRKQAY